MLKRKPRETAPMSDYAECFYAFYGESLSAVERPRTFRKAVRYCGMVGVFGALGLGIAHFASCGSEETTSASSNACSCSNLVTGNLNTDTLKFNEFDDGLLNLNGNIFNSAAPGMGTQLWWNTNSSAGPILSSGISDQNSNYSELVQLNDVSHSPGWYGGHPPGPIGQGELRLLDHAMNPQAGYVNHGWLALGPYYYGWSLSTPNLFECFTHGFSIRDYDATGTPVLYVRDMDDRWDIEFYEDGNYGHVRDTGPNTTVTIDSWLRLFDPAGNPWYVWPDTSGVLHATQTPPGPFPLSANVSNYPSAKLRASGYGPLKPDIRGR